MRTTIDIPDETYKTVKRVALEKDTSVKQLILEALQLLLLRQSAQPPVKKLKLPLIHSTGGEKINLTNEEIYDLIDLP